MRSQPLHPRPCALRRAGTAAAASAVAVVAVVALAGPASAHVTVHADDPSRGATDVAVAFRVPNERDHASTTKLEVELPTNPPLTGVLVAAHPGWTSSVKTVQLTPPVQTDDGPVTEAVNQITWTARTAADAIPPGGYADFDLDVGALPDTASLTFKALQTYSNGELVRWIGVQQAGQPEPDNPAPVLALSPAADSAGTTATPAGAATASPATATPAASAKTGGSDTTARVLAGVAIALAIVLGAGGYVLGRRQGAHHQPPNSPDPST